ncbi:glutamate racemase [Chelatococcus reniformis]|uniref:Glutamate racemase n=1 Tax=Chelatococcus reniformis TaxID=1494448 RepID=A0A916US11_9HYPH|nr:glutamate racemase [Chelatococcus reniformis]GGC84529.1 glutamate racemase [Chelatococcus reniformis]
MTHPAILVFDSGLGGLTVYREVARARPDARFVYAADDAVFPYGRLAPDVLVARVMAVLEERIAAYAPELVVIACHTASTLVLPHLRARFTMPFVGTVPAIKPAAAASRSRRVSVLATPGTVARDYTHELVRAYAGDCDVALVGSTRLASYAETIMAGGAVADTAIAAEIAPCFREDAERRTDTVVLACTHYPLLLDRLERLAPWPVSWIDPAPAIARRVLQLIGDDPVDGAAPGGGTAIFTDGAAITPALEATLAGYGLPLVVRAPLRADEALSQRAAPASV